MIEDSLWQSHLDRFRSAYLLLTVGRDHIDDHLQPCPFMRCQIKKGDFIDLLCAQRWQRKDDLVYGESGYSASFIDASNFDMSLFYAVIVFGFVVK